MGEVIPYKVIYIKMLMLVIIRLSNGKLKFWWHVNWFNVYFLLHFLLGLISYQFKNLPVTNLSYTCPES